MEFRILGPLEVVSDGHLVPLQAAKPRALLAMLLLHASVPISSDRLIEDLWNGDPPATAAKVLQTYVSQLRKALGTEAVIVTGPSSYELRVERRDVDSHRFEQLAAEAPADDPPGAARALREALALWRGPPLIDFANEPWAEPEIGRLEELRLRVLQARIDADLALGRHAELVGELEPLVAQYPLVEPLRGQLMLVLYRSGRQAEALEAFREGRQTLVEQLGIEPAPELRRLERLILHHDSELDLPPVGSGAALGGPPARGFQARPTSFVGRARELRQVRTLLARADVRLVTLSGPAGVGKTRLAFEAAARIQDDFAHGSVLVELASARDPTLIATTIAGTLGLRETPGLRAADVLIAYLGRRQALLILDNFEHVLEAAPLLAELLAGAPGVKLLVTSRAPLDLVEEWIYVVPALELPDASRPPPDRLARTEAIRLFVERARDVRPEFELTEANADAVADLCVRLDGLPLALELAAARIKLLSPAAILERLELLKAEPGTGAPDRHRTLGAAIDWSYDLLGEEEQSLFTSIAVFVGGFTLSGAEAVAGDLELDVVAGIETLLANNLLRTERMAAGEPRFGMLETIREYAGERLAQRGDGDAVRRRHAGFYLLLAEAAMPALRGAEQLLWVERLDVERDNIRAALTWATENGDAEIGLRTATSLWRYWQLRGSLNEGRERLEGLLARRGGSSVVRAGAQSALAALALVQGDHEAVGRLIAASLPVHRRVGAGHWVASCLGMLAQSVMASGDIERASALTQEGLDVARKTGELSLEGMLLANVGAVLAWSGKLEEAERVVAESIRTARLCGDLRSVGNRLITLGGIALALRDAAQARRHFEESLSIHRRLDDSWGISHSLSFLALMAHEAHDDGAAQPLLAESLVIEREAGDHPGLPHNLEVSARLAAAQDRPARAARLYASASALRETVGTHLSSIGWPDPAPDIARLRATLGEEAFAEAWGQGRAMATDESIAYALEEQDLGAFQL